MPELPEVETVRRGLDRLLAGRRVSRVFIRDLRVLQGFSLSGLPKRSVTPQGFEKNLRNQRILRVDRRGKYLLLRLSSGGALIGHLRMTGQLIYGPPHAEARAQIGFEGLPDVLNFCDTRRFGELWISKDWTKDPSLKDLGPEPLRREWDVPGWGVSLRASHTRLHSALLDQRRLAGLGNIYAMEALFECGLRPTRRCDTLTRRDIPPLAEGVRRVLTRGLSHRGVSFNSYRDALGRKGQAQNHLMVYGRAGKPCNACGTVLRSVRISGRGAVFCPRCQK
ncbi:MAG: bifunctional DNA-formamidopyrimidine glycosylase/DNA-(apurinic or apyrimidinic site) lyase [Elusimicrobia bacterium]|nr:bifunctional DNA-formamidopyrimidine glycosylase/DNA-(apurinic or apyrimidinic site) lyase [Elusimicrobiota bacterium]